MQLDFVSVEEFYFALTLDTRLLYEWHDPALVEQVGSKLKACYGEPSTVAAARQNTFNYVFRVVGDLPTNTLIELLDWGEHLRLNSNYGLERTPAVKSTAYPPTSNALSLRRRSFPPSRSCCRFPGCRIISAPVRNC